MATYKPIVLYSGKSKQLLSTDRLRIGSVSIGTIAAGDVTSNVKLYKLPLYDANDNLIGYIQVYGATASSSSSSSRSSSSSSRSSSSSSSSRSSSSSSSA